MPGGSKKKAGNIGKADITWQIPYAGILVWEVKIWAKKYQASNEAKGYVAAFIRAGIPSFTGFNLSGVLYGREVRSGEVMRVFSFGAGGILYQVMNTPKPRPKPKPQPNPSPVPHINVRWQDIILLIVLGVVVRLVVVAAAA